MESSNERQEAKTAKELAEGTVLNYYNDAHPDKLHREWMIRNNLDPDVAKFEWEVQMGLKKRRRGKPKSQNAPRCSVCGKLGHDSQSCKGKQGRGRPKGQRVIQRCSRCEKVGHNAQTCKAKYWQLLSVYEKKQKLRKNKRG